MVLELILFASLVVVVYQDLKIRLIHIGLPFLIFGFAIALNWGNIAHIEWFRSLGFLIFNFVVVTLYFSFKKRAFLNPMDRLIGWGDFLFLVAVTPLFTFRNYLKYFVLGMVFSLLLFLLMKWIYPKYGTIPLAGFLSLFLIGIKIIETLTAKNLLT